MTEKIQHPENPVAQARETLARLRQNIPPSNEFETRIAAAVEEKMEAGLTREQAEEVVKAQAYQDAREVALGMRKPAHQ